MRDKGAYTDIRDRSRNLQKDARRAPIRRQLLFLVIAAVMRRLTIVRGGNGNLRELAAAFFAVVVFACGNVAHNGLLVLHS